MRVVVVEDPSIVGFRGIVGDDGYRRIGCADANEVRVCSMEARDQLPVLVAGADIVVMRTIRFGEETLGRAPRLRFIQKLGAGYENVDVKAATARHILVANTDSMNKVSVAEHAFLLMLMCGRHYADKAEELRTGQWSLGHAWATELYGRTLGIIGLGNIGREIAARARAFGMPLLALKRAREPEGAEALAVEFVGLDDLLRRSDFVVLSLAMTPEARGMIGARELSLMKPTTFLINVSRGAVVDEAALITALEEGRIAGAGLDVFAQEPLPPGHPLFSCPRVILTPHYAGTADGSVNRLWSFAADNVARVTRGDPPLSLVNPEVIAGHERLVPKG